MRKVEKARRLREQYPEKAAEIDAGETTLDDAIQEIEEEHLKALVEEGKAFPKNVRVIIRRLQWSAKALEDDVDTLFEPGHWNEIWKAWVRLATVMRKVKRIHKGEYGL